MHEIIDQAAANGPVQDELAILEVLPDRVQLREREGREPGAEQDQDEEDEV
jgi:hypothetical protein